MEYQLQRLLQLGHNSRTASARTHHACRQLLGWESAVWFFLEAHDPARTNNLSEGRNRHPFLSRESTVGSYSPAGSRLVERILSTVASLSAQ